jgi:hypothetical protein
MVEIAQPPGSLSTMGKIWEGVKHVGKKALKGGIIGAVIGGVIAAAGGLLLGAALFSWIPIVGPALGAALGGKLGMMAGVLMGAKVGAIIGGGVALTNADEAIQVADERGIANAERQQTREMQMASMEQQYTQKQISLAQQAQQLGGQSLPSREQGINR